MITRKTPLKKIIELGGECRQCGSCCSFGSGYLVDEDIPRIADFLGISEKELKEKYLEKIHMYGKEIFKPLQKKKGKQYGECIFLKGKKCSIHKVKPLNCRIGTCNEHGEEISVWFALNYFVDEKNPQSIRDWKVYLDLGGRNIEGGKLDELVPNKTRLRRILNYEVL